MKKRLRGNFAQCAGCELYFRSAGAHARHRTGKNGARRCRTPDEMMALGMEIDAKGYWHTPMSEEQLKRRLGMTQPAEAI
jgi:hypothetical protein